MWSQGGGWRLVRPLQTKVESAILAFLLGIVTVWLYAAIRPRFGAGPGAAVMAGLAVFFLAYVYTTVGMTGMGFFPANVMFITLGWGLVEILVASVAGAWAYKE